LHQITSDTDLHYEIELIITEALSNVVVHGYNGHDDGDLTIHVSVDDQKRLILTVNDCGKPFYGPDKDNLDPYKDLYMESGRGIFIISQLVDRFFYKHENGINILQIEKDITKRKLKKDT
jgi:serine/threonine-protein kinase RsbW